MIRYITYYYILNNPIPHRSRPIDPDESMRINSDDESIPYKKGLTEDSPEPTEPVKVDNIDSPLPGVEPEPNPNTFGLPLQYSEPAYDDTLTYRTPPYNYDQNLDQNQTEPLPPPPPPPQPAQPGQSRQWTGETEIN